MTPAHLAHFDHWPEGVPHAVSVPDESLWEGFNARAMATPDGTALHFLGRTSTWAELRDAALHLAGGLQQRGVRKGDRVVLFMQNCPQFIIGVHAVWRVGGVVVPVNPMNKADELVHYLADAQAHVAIASSDIAPELARASEMPEAQQTLHHLLVFDLAEALPRDHAAHLGEWPAVWQNWLPVRHAYPTALGVQVHAWAEVMAQRCAPAVVPVSGDDLALLPYTSGTTGLPKGCMHTHATLLHNVLASGPWLDVRAGDASLVVVPMFHITGLVIGLLTTIRCQANLVVLPRWDRRQAALAIATHRVTHWANIPTMVMDLLGDPSLAAFDLSSLRYIGGGGAAMPEAVAAEMYRRLGLVYVEGYGLTETAAPTHTNPRHAAKRQCLGIPICGTQVHIIDPNTLQPLPTGEVGEIVVRGPQVFKGYWNQPEATEQAFTTVEGQRYFRTGDLGRTDEQGYFYMADRLKRMINASGFKVWPAEVEALLHHHPAIQEVCVIATREAYRGESVKAVIVLRQGFENQVSADDIIAWSRDHMAAYKYPRDVEFVTALPRNASGKVMWRTLQEQQDARQLARDPVSTAS